MLVERGGDSELLSRLSSVFVLVKKPKIAAAAVAARKAVMNGGMRMNGGGGGRSLDGFEKARFEPRNGLACINMKMNTDPVQAPWRTIRKES